MAGQIHNNENYVAARFQHNTSYKTRETEQTRVSLSNSKNDQLFVQSKLKNITE